MHGSSANDSPAGFVMATNVRNPSGHHLHCPVCSWRSQSGTPDVAPGALGAPAVFVGALSSQYATWGPGYWVSPPLPSAPVSNWSSATIVLVSRPTADLPAALASHSVGRRGA
jgi:hypothetical protein